MFLQLDLKAAIHICENMREMDAHSIHMMHGEFSKESFAIGRWQTNGAAFAYYLDGEPVCMGGLSEVTPWSVVAWLISTDRLNHDSWKKIIRFTRKVLANASKKYRRIDAQCLGSWPDAQKYARSFGFEFQNLRINACSDGGSIIEFAIIGEE